MIRIRGHVQSNSLLRHKIPSVKLVLLLALLSFLSFPICDRTNLLTPSGTVGVTVQRSTGLRT